jgi:hypothetical protein
MNALLVALLIVVFVVLAMCRIIRVEEALGYIGLDRCLWIEDESSKTAALIAIARRAVGRTAVEGTVVSHLGCYALKGREQKS